MNFHLFDHEIEALKFYQKTIESTEDAEIKKEALKLYSEFLKNLHNLERELHKDRLEHDKAQIGSSKEVDIARLSRSKESSY